MATSDAGTAATAALGSTVDAAALRDAIVRKLTYDMGKSRSGARDRDWFLATALAVRDRVIDRWLEATRAAYEQGEKQVYYLSLEFLVGRLLRDNVSNLGLIDALREALAPLGVDFDAVRQAEPDAALGNGGLGRLAACFMESMASLAHPRLRLRHPLRAWPVPADPARRAGSTNTPRIGCTSATPGNSRGRRSRTTSASAAASRRCGSRKPMTRHVWHPAETVQAVAYDTPVVGWRGEHVNTLRLWSARALDPLKLEAFNLGDHVGALADRVRQEAISKVLYPSRRIAGRPGIAAAAGILLHLGLAAGPRAAAPAGLWRPALACRTRWRSSSTTRIRRSPSPS